MAETVKDIKDWLNTLDESARVGIDDGGLSLQEVGGAAYFEIGGTPGPCDGRGCDDCDGCEDEE